MNDAAVIVGIIGAICTILFSFAAYRAGIKKDGQQEGERGGELRSDIEYIKLRTTEILAEQRDMGKHVNELTERLARVEASASSAHHRMDEHIKNHIV